MHLVLNNSLDFEWLIQIARRLKIGAVSTDFLQPKKVVVVNMPSGVYSQVSPKVFRLGRKSFGRWRWEVLLNEDEMEKVKRRWFWNGLKKSAWPILEFVTLRSKFVTLISPDFGGRKKAKIFLCDRRKKRFAFSNKENDDVAQKAFLGETLSTCCCKQKRVPAKSKIAFERVL